MEDVLQKNNWNTKHMIVAISITASIVFSGTMIWSRFLFVEGENAALRERVEYINDRIDTKHNAQKGYIDGKIKNLSADNVNQWGVINSKQDKVEE